MEKRGFLERHGIVRNAIRKDILYFAIPAILVFFVGLQFCSDLSGFWGTIWGLIQQPEDLFKLPIHRIIGLALFVVGLSMMLISQATLWRNYSGTVIIRKDHKLVTHGIYRFTRNPIYLGGLMAVIGLPVYAASMYGFLTMLFLIPLILFRITLEEKLLGEEFQDSYQQYKETTKKLIPFIY